MLKQATQATVLTDLQEGDVLEHGALFKFDPKEKLVWRCMEVVEVQPDERLYTFHIYYRGIMLKAAHAILHVSNKSVDWRLQ